MDSSWRGRFSRTGIPVVSCSRGNISHTVFKIYNKDGTLYAERNISLLSLVVAKMIEIRAGYTSEPVDQTLEKFTLSVYIDWQSQASARLLVDYAPSTCGVSE